MYQLSIHSGLVFIDRSTLSNVCSHYFNACTAVHICTLCFERDINTIFKSAAACGVNYDEIYEACYKRYGKSHITLAKWSSNQFSTVIIDGKDIGTGDDAGPLLKTDKMVGSNSIHSNFNCFIIIIFSCAN